MDILNFPEQSCSYHPVESHQLNILLTVPRRYFFCSFMFFCLVFVMPLCASVYLCLVVTCCVKADLLVLVCGVCEFVTFPLVFWVRCGT